ncbi:hypothetical protein N3K66_002935 [Trichothecium roseum]|uniref:Uncharacterized protein n=1 Tax=Trichothecium roseum TaxID=47278 RepID=A0ACC0V422_9HYPO|nr:hypothetical protein N3K66_002935 [Trichothecium roseum]
MVSAAQQTLAWRIASQSEDLSGLTLSQAPLTQSLKPGEVLVELRAASLNYRDIVLATGTMGLKTAPNVVPGSDGAGMVIATGSSDVDGSPFKPGDHVLTFIVPRTFPVAARPELGPVADETRTDMSHICAGLGHELDGTLATYGVFDEGCLVKHGGVMTPAEAATLSCSGITAWNALWGQTNCRGLGEGEWLLVQGTGGVSVAALQFALAAGANVIAITSSEDKATRLRNLGAHHVINYRETPDWGSVARALTPGGRGVDMVVDVAGNATLEQSIRAVRIDGVVALAGMVGKAETVVPMMAALNASCAVRGVIYGTRLMMRDLVAFVEKHGVKPAVDEEVFGLEDAKAAFNKLREQRHFSKVIIQIPAQQQ